MIPNDKLTLWGKILVVAIPTIGVIVGYANLTSDVGIQKVEIANVKEDVDALVLRQVEVEKEQAVTTERFNQILDAIDELQQEVKDARKKGD